MQGVLKLGWHIEISLVSLIFMMIITIDCYFHVERKLLQEKVFFATLCIIDIFLALNIFVDYMVANPFSLPLYHLALTLYNSVVTLISVMFLIYAMSLVESKYSIAVNRWIGAFLIPCIIFALLSFINPWTGWIYTLSPDLVYTRQFLWYGMPFLIIMFNVIQLIYLFRKRKRIFPLRKMVLLLAGPVAIFIAMIIQITTHNILMGLFYTILALVNYLYIQNYRETKDGLTGLLTRRDAIQLINEHIRFDQKRNITSALLVADIDSLKQINDSCGHYIGDKVIQMMAEELDTEYGNGAFTARIGGDEFIVFITECNDIDLLVEKAYQMNATMNTRLTRYVGNARLPMDKASISVGVTALAKEDKSFLDMYHRADDAMYAAKKDHKTCCVNKK